MNAVAWRLVASDLKRFGVLIAAAFAIGLISLPLMQVPLGPADSGTSVGLMLFVTDLVALGIFIAMVGLLKEHQENIGLFVLSLPISPAQYSRAKFMFALLAYFAPWSLLLVTVVLATLASADSPNGALPGFLAMMSLFACIFCLLMVLVQTTRSERWSIAGIVIGNLCVPIFLIVVLSQPDIAEHRNAASPVWTDTALLAIGLPLGTSILALLFGWWFIGRTKDVP